MEGTGVLINALAFIFRKRFNRDAALKYTYTYIQTTHIYIYIYFVAREKDEAREKA